MLDDIPWWIAPFLVALGVAAVVMLLPLIVLVVWLWGVWVALVLVCAVAAPLAILVKRATLEREVRYIRL